ncbi:MAG: hypothetical protein IJV34_05105 [Prevotella sp.]|nr:hypothetical protein [Prevotella sp.]
MRKLKLFLLTALTMLTGGGNLAWADDVTIDITSTRLIDANLSSTSGWTITKTNVGNNYGHITDGEVPMIEFYHSWSANPGTSIGSTQEFSITQPVTLTSGTYRLSAYGFYREGDGNGTSKASLIAGSETTGLVGLESGGLNSYDGNNDAKKAADAFNKEAFLNTLEFTLDSKQTINVGVNGSINTYCSWCVVGPMTLVKVLEDDIELTELIINPSFEAGTYTGTKDASSSIEQNADGHKYATGWTYLIKQTGWSNIRDITDNPADGNKAFETWAGTPQEFKVYQTITNLPEGLYEVSASARTETSASNDICTYAKVSGETSYSAPFDVSDIKTPWNGSANWQTLTARFSIVGGGNAEIGIHSTKFMQFDDFKLTYLGVEPLLTELKSSFSARQSTATALLANSIYENITGSERTTLSTKKSVTPTESVAGWTTANNELRNAIDAFTAAKTNYDALANEITKATSLGIDASSYAATSSTTAATALTSTQNLKVAEYTYVSTTYAHGVSLGEWTTTGPTGSLSAQHWSGEANPYLEQSSEAWGTGSWTIKYEQNLELPAGNYVFKVAGRQANSDGVTLSLVAKQDETTLGSVSDFPRGDRGLGITTSGATSFDPNDTFCNTRDNSGANLQTNGGNGWEWRFVKFTLPSAATVNVSVNAVATTEHMWVSFCDASVLTDNEANISLIAYNIAMNNATLARDNSTYSNVKGQEKADLLAAIDADGSLDKSDADAIDAAKDALISATTTFTAAATVTAWNRLTSAIATADNISAAHTDATTAWNSSSTTAAGATTAANTLYQTLLTNVLPGSYTLGFEDGEYAPYNTAAVKAFYTEDAVDADKVAAGSSATLHSAITNCQPNDGSVNAISNSGNFVADISSIGWTHSEWVGQESNYVCVTSASSITYGGTTGFEMPLKANTVYELKFRHAGWDSSNEDGGGTVSVLNDASEGLAATNYDGNTGNYKGTDANYKNETFRFKTGAAGNYELTVAGRSGRSTVKGFSLKKLPTVSVTVSAAGLATFCHSSALDFTHQTVKAYKASLDGDNTVLFTRIYEIPAEEGIVIKGDADTYSIPVIPSADAIDGNLMVGTLSSTAVAASTTGSYNYILANGSNGVGFYNVASATTSGAGKAYLHSETALKKESNGSRIAFIFSDEETTGIAEIESKATREAKVFNLNGQQVNKPSKGMYIVNGKKVIFK